MSLGAGRRWKRSPALLYLDPARPHQRGGLEGTATDIRAMICTGRSIDREPSPAAQAVFFFRQSRRAP